MSGSHFRANTSTTPRLTFSLDRTQLVSLVYLFFPLTIALEKSLVVSIIVRSISTSCSSASELPIMPLIDYDDFSFMSEDQCDQDEKDFQEDDSENDLDSNSEEDEVPKPRTDIDEYASFFTDYEKYQYDQLRWNGIPNTRKYTIAKKKRNGKGEGESQKKRPKVGESGKQNKSKTLPKPRKRGNNKTDVPLDQAVDIPEEGEIHFDARGNLWISYSKKNIYIAGKRSEGLMSVKAANGDQNAPHFTTGFVLA